MSFKVKLVHVDVTASDIKNGKHCMTRVCPIALALARVCNTGTSVQTHTFIVDGCNVVCSLPNSARNFIEAFDLLEPVGPFSFTCMAPVRQESLLEALRRKVSA